MFKVQKYDDTILILVLIITIGMTIFILFNNGTNFKVSHNEQNLIREEVKKKSKPKIKNKQLYVHLGGEVINPGVYKCKSGTRLYQILNQAGGATKKADLNVINLAIKLSDGQQIIIPSQKEIISDKLARIKDGNLTKNVKININTANKKQLMKLTGIGSTKANKIINYRQEVGKFNQLEDLKKISGIGAGTLVKIKNRITY